MNTRETMLAHIDRLQAFMDEFVDKNPQWIFTLWDDRRCGGWIHQVGLICTLDQNHPVAHGRPIVGEGTTRGYQVRILNEELQFMSEHIAGFVSATEDLAVIRNSYEEKYNRRTQVEYIIYFRRHERRVKKELAFRRHGPRSS